MPQPAYTERFGEFLKGLLDFGSKKEHLSKAMPPRGAEISLQPVVTEEMILTVDNLAFSEAKSWIDRRAYVVRKSCLSKDPEIYRQVRFSHSGNADMYANIVGAEAKEAMLLPEFPNKANVDPHETMVWFGLQ